MHVHESGTADKAQLFTWLSTVSFSSPSLGWIPFHSFEPSEKAHVLSAFRPSFWASLQTGGLTSAKPFHKHHMMVTSHKSVLQWTDNDYTAIISNPRML